MTPLVSVGIPTFNRAERLRRAAESVLGQTYENLELVISDDGSDDATEEVGRALAAGDPRVRYLRADVNRGLSANYNVVYGSFRGDYVMALADDDWLAADYVERCLGALGGDVVLACGRARYLNAGSIVHSGRADHFIADQPARRVRQYLRAVDGNGILYGLMPRKILEHASPMRNVIANDWLVVASILAQGKAVTLEETSLFRDLGGTSASMDKLVSTLGAPRWHARVPHLVIAGNLMAEIGWRGSAFSALPPGARARLALGAGLAAINWRSLAWHIAPPPLRP